MMDLNKRVHPIICLYLSQGGRPRENQERRRKTPKGQKLYRGRVIT